MSKGLWIGASLLIGLAGCSQGSGRTASTAAGSTAGVGSGNVPGGTSAQRDPAGYDFSEQTVGSAAGGYVSALAPVQSGVLAANVPLRQVELLGVASEAGFLFDVTGLARADGASFAATGDATAPGSGDVYQRDAAGVWSQVLDGDHTSLVLAALQDELYACAGEVGRADALLQVRAPGGAWQGFPGLLPECVPTAAVAHGGQVWIGAGPVTADGPARLLRGTWAGFMSVAFPGAGAGAGERQEVSALLSTVDGLVVATVRRDGAGAALGGEVWRVPDMGQSTLLGSFLGDAPLALAWQDETVYVGTGAGRLLFLDGQTLRDEPGLPANLGVHSLLAPDRTTLLIGVAGPSGAAVLVRTSRTAGFGTTPPAGGSGAGALGYLQHVKPLLLASCAACHATLQTNFTVSMGLADDAADYQAVLAQVDLAAPASSALLTKGSATVAHAGGAPWPTGSAQADTVLAWVQGGALFDASTAPGGAAPTTPAPAPTASPAPVASPPPPPPPTAGATRTFLVDVRPQLASCVGCHTNATGFRLSAGLTDPMVDFQGTLTQVQAGNPAGSALLSKGAGQAHAGGALWPVGSAVYTAVAEWIQAGAPYGTAGATPPPPTLSANPTYLVDAKPILLACAACHSNPRVTDDFPLSAGLTNDASDYARFLGIINLTTPEASGLLRRATREASHPVQVFPKGSLPYQTLLNWIQKGAKFN